MSRVNSLAVAGLVFAAGFWCDFGFIYAVMLSAIVYYSVVDD